MKDEFDVAPLKNIQRGLIRCSCSGSQAAAVTFWSGGGGSGLRARRKS